MAMRTPDEGKAARRLIVTEESKMSQIHHCCDEHGTRRSSVTNRFFTTPDGDVVFPANLEMTMRIKLDLGRLTKRTGNKVMRAFGNGMTDVISGTSYTYIKLLAKGYDVPVLCWSSKASRYNRPSKNQMGEIIVFNATQDMHEELHAWLLLQHHASNSNTKLQDRSDVDGERRYFPIVDTSSMKTRMSEVVLSHDTEKQKHDRAMVRMMVESRQLTHLDISNGGANVNHEET